MGIVQPLVGKKRSWRIESDFGFFCTLHHSSNSERVITVTTRTYLTSVSPEIPALAEKRKEEFLDTDRRGYYSYYT